MGMTRGTRVPRSTPPEGGRGRTTQAIIDASLGSRRQQTDQIALLKAGGRNRRQQRWEDGTTRTTFTASFTLTTPIDQLIDKWAAKKNRARAEIVRQAIMLADAHWSKR